MTAKWVFEYFTAPSTWTAFTAKFNGTNEILNGHEELELSLPNTTANRAFLANNQTVRVSYDTNIIFTGLLSALEYGRVLNCFLYNNVYETLKPKTITAVYQTPTDADTIFAAICAAAGVSAGTCPSTPIKVQFDETSCYDAVMFLKDCLNTDIGSSGNTLNLGAKGSAKTITHYRVKSRGVDRSKLRDYVRVKGTDTVGNVIVGEAGSGYNVKVYREKKASDVATLDALAEKYLAELNTVSKGAPLEVPIEEAYDLYPGDTVTVNNARYNLSGSHRIMQVNKYNTKATVQIDKEQQTLEAKLLDVKKYEDIGIYSIVNPATLNYQGLELFQLLNEGVDGFIKDYAPQWHQGIGNGITWTPSFNGLACTFQGAGYILSGCDWGFAGTDKFTLSLWLTPETISNEDPCVLLVLPNNFQVTQLQGTLKVGIYTGSGSTYHEVTVAGALTAGVRKHLVATYDGTDFKVFLNKELVGSLTVTGNFSAFNPNWEMCMGSDYGSNGYVGQIDTYLLFSRCVIESEVNDLYRYSNLLVPPTLQASNDLNTYNLKHHFHMNEGSGSTVISDVFNPTIEGTIYGCSWETVDASPQLVFSSANSVVIPGLTIGETEKLAIGCWVTPEVAQSKGLVFFKNEEVELRVESGGVLFRFWVGEAMTGVGTTPLLIVPSKKYFIMATYDGVYARIYVNGTERARQAINGVVDLGIDAISYLGGSDTAGTNGFHGVISELMIWRG